MTLNDSTRRSIRSLLDLAPAVLASIVVMVPVLGLSAAQVTKVGAFIAALTVALAKLRNALEDGGFIPALLKAPASDGADPVPDPQTPPTDAEPVVDEQQVDPAMSVSAQDMPDDDVPAPVDSDSEIVPPRVPWTGSGSTRL